MWKLGFCSAEMLGACSIPSHCHCDKRTATVSKLLDSCLLALPFFRVAPRLAFFWCRLMLLRRLA